MNDEAAEDWRVFRYTMKSLSKYYGWKKTVYVYRYQAVLVGAATQMPFLIGNNDNCLPA